MADISEVPGISEAGQALLREVEVGTVEQLVSLEAGEILARIDRVRVHHAGSGQSPSAELVEAWQNTARKLLRRRVGIPVTEAKEVSLESLRSAGIDLALVPVADVVEDTPAGERAIEVVRETGPRARGKAGGASPQEGEPGEVQDARMSFQPLEDRRDVSRGERRRNRGMSHPDAGRVRWAAVVTVVTMVVSIPSIAGLVAVAILLIFTDVRFDWTVALFSLVFPFCFLLYLLQGIRVRCRLCGQRLFLPRKCLKHKRAGRSILGPTFATARSAVIFASFRCMYCGTKTRLKD